MEYKLVKLIKLKESDDPLHPGNIEIGYEKTGGSTKDPKVGECFFVGSLRTSTVQEILSENTFRTYNSIYQWEVLEEVNEDKL